MGTLKLHGLPATIKFAANPKPNPHIVTLVARCTMPITRHRLYDNVYQHGHDVIFDFNRRCR